MSMRRFLLVACALAAFSSPAAAATFEVGPGKPFLNINDVPWEALAPGDLVLINARPTPYNEKWVICRQGTQAMPITVRGVPDPTTGALPIIDGANATSRMALDYPGQDRGVIKIGSANVPMDTNPTDIVIEN